MAYGITMMVGTLGVLYVGWHAGHEQRAITTAFTTFVLFQVFNVFNARAERGTAFNKHFFDNAMLWASLAGVVLLQSIAVYWPPAQLIMGTTAMSATDWGIAIGVASSVLPLEETRKLLAKLLFSRYRLANRSLL